jgi:serine/threonine-protein kinase
MFEAIDRFWLASEMGNMVEARLQTREAKSKGADELTLLSFEAFMFLSTGKYLQAAESYGKAFKLRPSSGLLYNTAFSYWRLGDLVKAEIVLRDMLMIVSNNYKAIRLQANIWLLQGKLELAISAFNKIVFSLNNGTDLTNLSLAYALNKQYGKSLEFAQKAYNKDPNNPINLLNLADIETIIGNEKSAGKHYQEVITTLIGKNEVKYLTNLAQAYAQLNQADLAITAINKAKSLAPINGEVSYASAIVYSLLKEKNSAIHHVKLALNQNVGAVWFNLPWFDNLCYSEEFKQLMSKNNNIIRCSY